MLDIQTTCKLFLITQNLKPLLIGIIFLIGGIELYFILKYAFFVKGRNNQHKRSFILRCLIGIGHLIVMTGILCIWYGYFIEPYWVDVKKISVLTEKLDNTNFRIVHLSDFHCEEKKRIEDKIVDIVNSFNPDIIVFTGDSLNSVAALPVFQDTMRKLNANIAKYAIRGNWDVWHKKRVDIFSNTDFIVLDEKTVKISKEGENIYLSGLEYTYAYKYHDLLKNIARDSFSIFLYHSPDLAQDLKGLNVDLYLCGHTHGGQVNAPFYGALITCSRYGKKYESGKYRINDMILYVNRGIGMEGGSAPRVRFLCRPQIAVFDIGPVS